MSTFELKTHQVGRTYSNPHFFILNKGLNSGKPLPDPCPNCFVVITKTETDKNTLFYLSMMLQIGGFYAHYLKGSVIPFISIDDCRNTLKKGLISNRNNSGQIQKLINVVEVITKKQNELQNTINKMSDLKMAYIRNCFNLMQSKVV
ncbi:hypothetical protein DFQ11_10313 [Winogradskyella epiphytica]|uniref:Type I restriction modification DNA specificity protein n=1 Tax=Winogradskyella epiphytica TaxID=262005 RepID=A0A2V4XHY0_9FLAO|nr:hypothetical protein [Winogradskyella epiphytica]PYE80933.1 hypothetical protein DFQ11_10313 [Winogradskyella epiphytica]GGW65632.1 hypothetical protein GCM10008085_16770 [Winogradskyella epiphytica]